MIKNEQRCVTFGGAFLSLYGQLEYLMKKFIDKISEMEYN